MKIMVTGAAGFIGSHLTERLLSDGHHVIGIDMFLKPESKPYKLDNISNSLRNPSFTFVEGNLMDLDLNLLLQDVDVVFHQAAIAGVRDSWGHEFQNYVQMNILSLQRLLEACRFAKLKKFIYASSSSVYGRTTGLTSEDENCQPISPYGLTKLAGEHLVHVYHVNFGLPSTSLRYFTVYGPRQRPDMAFHKFLKCALQGNSITVYGDGNQTRDFTYVSDAVEANILAMQCAQHGNVFNIGGGKQVSVNQVLQVIREVTGRTLLVDYIPPQPGDPKSTGADTSRAFAHLGYRPQASLKYGIEQEWNYIKHLYSH